MKFIKNTPFYPFALTSYSILALLSVNIYYFEVWEGLRALFVSLTITLVFLLIVQGVVKDWHRTALICSLGLILFFSYGHLYNFFDDKGIFIARHRFMLSVWGVIFGICSWWIIKKRSNFHKLTEMLNVVSAIALVLPLVQISTYQFQYLKTPSNSQIFNVNNSDEYTISQNFPDIYHIILDGYAREDVLNGYFAYDNRPLIEALTKRGFFVASCSQSNYDHTQESITSMLNLNYINKIPLDQRKKNTWKISVVHQFLRAQGYTIIAFDNWHNKYSDLAPDIYLAPDEKILSRRDFFSLFNNFEISLLKTTAGLALIDIAKITPRVFKINADQATRRRTYEQTLFTLNELENLQNYESPKYVMAHMISPHAPYVFGKNGDFLFVEPTLVPGYISNLEYLNSRILNSIDILIENSHSLPVIIIHGDHGWPRDIPEYSLPILNAFYLPNGGDQKLYKTITPVNTFRIIFNQYFGTNYDLVNDLSYQILEDGFQENLNSCE